MHGFGIHFNLNEQLRGLSGRLAFSRPLRPEPQRDLVDPTNLQEIRDKWYFIENMQKSDHYLLALVKRHQEAFFKEMGKRAKPSVKRAEQHCLAKVGVEKGSKKKIRKVRVKVLDPVE